MSDVRGNEYGHEDMIMLGSRPEQPQDLRNRRNCYFLSRQQRKCGGMAFDEVC